MSWLTACLQHKGDLAVVEYAEHPSEAAAEVHARNLRATGHRETVVFWSEITSALKPLEEKGEVA